MRRLGAEPGLSQAQRDAASRGLKALIPVGRPFLDYILSGLADAGCRRVCVVISPGHSEIREYYVGRPEPPEPPPRRIALAFAEQLEPRGTADAVLAAEEFASGDSVLVVNADNLYPRSALEALRCLPRAGMVGFRSSALIRLGNVPPERIGAFALIERALNGELVRIVEKPGRNAAATFGADPLVSMNAWLLPPSIFDSCRAIAPSPRNELELQDAVRHSIDSAGERYQVVESEEGVLDLSTPADIPEVARRVRHLEVNL